MKIDNRNLTMIMDLYELTMAKGYFENGMKDQIVYFDVFYRDNPDHGGYAIAAGLEQIVEYIQALHFTEEDIDQIYECSEKSIFKILHNYAEPKPYVVEVINTLRAQGIKILEFG